MIIRRRVCCGLVCLLKRKQCYTNKLSIFQIFMRLVSKIQNAAYGNVFVVYLPDEQGSLTLTHGHSYRTWHLATSLKPPYFKRSSASSSAAPIFLVSAFTWFHHLCLGLLRGRLLSGLDFIAFFRWHCSPLLLTRLLVNDIWKWSCFGAYQCSLPVSYQTKYTHKRMEGCEMFSLIKLQYITFTTLQVVT